MCSEIQSKEGLELPKDSPGSDESAEIQAIEDFTTVEQNGKKMFQCQQCHKRFGTHALLSKHMNGYTQDPDLFCVPFVILHLISSAV